MSERLGPSAKYLEIDLTTTVPPFAFAAAFAAAYPRSGWAQRPVVSRCIVAVDGPGSLTLKDTEGDEVTWSMQASEANEIAAVGIEANDGITTIKVFL